MSNVGRCGARIRTRTSITAWGLSERPYTARLAAIRMSSGASTDSASTSLIETSLLKRSTAPGSSGTPGTAAAEVAAWECNIVLG